MQLLAQRTIKIALNPSQERPENNINFTFIPTQAIDTYM